MNIKRQRELATVITETMQVKANELGASGEPPTKELAFDCVLSAITEFFSAGAVKVAPDGEQDAQLAVWLEKYHPLILEQLREVLLTEVDSERSHWSLVDFCDLHHEKLYGVYCGEEA